MKTIKIDGVPYDLPTKWEEVNYEKYIKMVKLNEPNPTLKSIEIISILSGVPKEIMLDAEPELTELIAKEMKFTSKSIPEIKPKETIIINGVEHNYNNDLKSVNLAQYVDIDFRLNEFKNDPEIAMTYVLAILYTKEGKYNSTYSIDLQKQLLLLPFVEVTGVIGFFLSKLKRYKKITQIYLAVRHLSEMMRLNMLRSVSDGDGYK